MLLLGVVVVVVVDTVAAVDYTAVRDNDNYLFLRAQYLRLLGLLPCGVVVRARYLYCSVCDNWVRIDSS